MSEDYEIYPLIHRDLFINIITEYVLTHHELRRILDILYNSGVFEGIEEVDPLDYGRSFVLNTEEFSYSVEVYGCEVFLYNRKPISEESLKNTLREI